MNHQVIKSLCRERGGKQQDSRGKIKQIWLITKQINLYFFLLRMWKFEMVCFSPRLLSHFCGIWDCETLSLRFNLGVPQSPICRLIPALAVVDVYKLFWLPLGRISSSVSLCRPGEQGSGRVGPSFKLLACCALGPSSEMCLFTGGTLLTGTAVEKAD